MARVTIKFTSEQLHNILAQACTSSKYWMEHTYGQSLLNVCQVLPGLRSRRVNISTYTGCIITLRAHRLGCRIEVDTDEHPHRVALLLRGDGAAADAVVQLLAFGDIVYG